MNEAQSGEVEKVLLFISDARMRAEKARSRLDTDGADEHLVTAMDAAEAALASVHKQLMQGTYYAVPEQTQQLAA